MKTNVSKNKIKVGKLLIVNLAGSENSKKALSNITNKNNNRDIRKRENVQINKSLLALSKCMETLNNTQLNSLKAFLSLF